MNRTRKTPDGFPRIRENNWNRVVEGLRVPGRFFEMLLSELRSPVVLGRRKALRGWMRGFDKLSTLLYDLDSEQSKFYLNTIQHNLRGGRINGAYDFLVNHKLLTVFLLEHAGLPFPELLAFTQAGRLKTEKGLVADPEQWLKARLEEQGKLVCKPIRKSGGSGFLALRRYEERVFLDRDEISLEEVVACLHSYPDMIVTEYVEQAEYSKKLYPDTSNTIRLLTMWDHEKKEPFVASACQRIGTSHSFPVDAWKGGIGGLNAEIDVRTGGLGKGAVLENRRTLVWLSTHPESEAQVEGIVVPGWHSMVSRVLQACRSLAFAPQIGWDILMTDSGFSVLEINGQPGIPIHQVHRPLLADPRVVRFYREHQVI